jgi:hypothetical protein
VPNSSLLNPLGAQIASLGVKYRLPAIGRDIRIMAKRPKRPPDPNQLAKLIADIATGEAENTRPAASTPGTSAATCSRVVAVAVALPD